MNINEWLKYKFENFKATDGTQYRVKIPRKRSDIESFFLFSLHKCGSTLLNNIFRDICVNTNISYIDINSDTFSQGIPFQRVDQDIEKILWECGYAYIGFRSFFSFNPTYDYSRQKKILFIRDPKDAVVSFYFSVKYSHVVPGAGALSDQIKTDRDRLKSTDINMYALNKANDIKKKYERYSLLPSGKNLNIYKYEDVIFDKLNWAKDMCAYLDIDIRSGDIERIIAKHDIVPEQENPDEHIRQVHPGNHKKYLSKETIDKLNECFIDINKMYGYG